METISSPKNPKLKLARSLTTRRGRLRAGMFAVEGEDLVAAGFAAGWKPKFALVRADTVLDRDLVTSLRRTTTLLVDAKVLADVAELAHPPRIIATFGLPEDDDVVFEPQEGTRVATARLYLDGVRDPGNVGTLLRAAHAFGIEAVGIGPGSADPFSPKATRASMGSVFHVRCVLGATIEEFAGSAPVVAVDGDAPAAVSEVELGETSVLCIGGERAGLGAEVMERATHAVSVPQQPGVDSLNAAVAGSIAMYEWSRQRNARSQ